MELQKEAAQGEICGGVPFSAGGLPRLGLIPLHGLRWPEFLPSYARPFFLAWFA